MTVPVSPLHDALFAIARALQITRPLTFFDCETTGVNVDTDRIVEFAWTTVYPPAADGQMAIISDSGYLNPQMPMPPGAIQIHGISDEMVAGAPTFAQQATQLALALTRGDLCAYNGRKFDIRVFAKEFERAGLRVAAGAVLAAHLIDPYIIFSRNEPRDLSAALKFYCDVEHADAHGAEPDVVAAIRVLAAQLARYPELPRTVAALASWCLPEGAVDRDGKFVWKGDEVVLAFGKHLGTPLRAVDPGFLRWMLGKEFADDTKQIARDALRGKFPRPPAATREAVAS